MVPNNNEAQKMNNCCVCNSEAVIKLLDFGMQPICNRFLKSPQEQEYKYPSVIGLCKSCGLVQITELVPAAELKPSYDWITYNEPEEHLDKLADMISKLSGVDKNSSVLGISFKDDTLLERMRKLGFQNVTRLDAQKELGIDVPYAGVESVQDKLDSKRAKEIVDKKGRFDLVIVRHILEHASDFQRFMKGIKGLVNPGGYVMFEVPDCTELLEHFDYSMVWEEHTMYFTSATFKNCFGAGGFSLEHFEKFIYSLENSLVGIVKPLKMDEPSFPDKGVLQKENSRGLTYSCEFPKIKNMLRSFFSDYKEKQGKITVFGAGHNACIFINIFELKNYIEFIIDDNINKQGLFMPGSLLPIYPSSSLIEKNVKLSMLSLNPDIEEKIIMKNHGFTDKKGMFLSLYPTSKRSLYSQLGSSSSRTSFREFNKEVFYADGRVISLEKKDIELFKEKAMHNERKRIRICAHKDTADKVHEMFIVHDKGTYVRPHKHINKSESFHIIEGSAFIIVFDDGGNVTEIVDMADYSTGKRFYYRISDSCYHTLFITSDSLVFHETTNGPFNKSDAVFAPWSPDEKDEQAVKKFMKKMEDIVEQRGSS